MYKLISHAPLVIFVILLSACNLPSNNPANATSTPTPAPAQPAQNDTGASNSAPAEGPTSTATPTPAPQEPTVLRATLCWKGPGDLYEVVSALTPNQKVKLLGKGSIPGWWIIENPIYHDPCWMASTDLQVDPGMDLSNLQTFTPPLLKPTKTPKPTITPTP